MSVISAALLLFLVMDPLGNVPLYLTALKEVAPERRKRIILRESVIALFVLVFFLFFGRFALAALQISESSLGIAGGIVLFLISIRMVFPSSDETFGRGPQGEPFIVPLAVPLVAGPSAVATILLLETGEPERWPAWLAALGMAWLFSTVTLFYASGLARRLGDRVLTAIERLMGMLLTTVAVQMLLTGLRRYLAS